MGLPASGKTLSLRSIDIWRVEGGMLAEHWDVIDVFRMRRQLGLAPGHPHDPAPTASSSPGMATRRRPRR